VVAIDSAIVRPTVAVCDNAVIVPL
jgi:hypothetical protein